MSDKIDPPLTDTLRDLFKHHGLNEPWISLYKKCMDTWGFNAQMLMLIEECAEAQQSVTKIFRYFYNAHPGDKRALIDKLLEEIIDLELMVNQMKYILFHRFNRFIKYDEIKGEKVARLKALLEELNK